MEAPKNIYLTKNLLGVLRDGWDAQPSEVFTNIEYTRTDAFMEKADEFISTFFHPDDTKLIDAVLNRFHEHMKLKIK